MDVGGNVGTWSWPLSDKFDNVIAFEPHPENRECYLKNMAEKTNRRHNLKLLKGHLRIQYELGSFQAFNSLS